MSKEEEITQVKKVGLARLAKARSINNGRNSFGTETSENLDNEVNEYSQTDKDYLEEKVGLSSKLNKVIQTRTYVPERRSVESIYIKKVSNDLALRDDENPDVVTEKPKDISSSPQSVSSSCASIPLNEKVLESSNAEENKEEKESTFASTTKSIFQTFNRKSFRKKKSENDYKNTFGNQLRAPKPVTRSRSLNRLSDAFSQVQQVCLGPTTFNVESDTPRSTGDSDPWTPPNGASSTTTDDEDADDEDNDDEFDSQESEFSDDPSSRRWSSMTQLNESRMARPYAQVKAAEARQKNYLFGGLGSLLGATELDRYFPDRSVLIFIATWNMNGKEPPTSLDDFLLPGDVEHMPDLYVIGTQESGGDRTEWEVRLQTTIGPSHVLFHSALLGILHLTVFLRRDLVWFCSVPEDASYSLRPGGTHFKTKGAIAISFQFFGTKMLFVNTHLFAHEEKLAQRIQNYKNIITNLDLPRNLRRIKIKKQKDVTNRYDVVFWLGDLNFRLVGDRDNILDKIKSLSSHPGADNDLLTYDQLTQTRNNHEIFHGFSEGPIRFAPTFKFDVGTNHYDTSYKQRVPSYTDRILYKSSRDPIKCTNYGCCPHFKTSDHKPVYGVFHFKLRPGKDDVPLAAGLFQRDVYLIALKRRRRFFHQPSSRNCQMQ